MQNKDEIYSQIENYIENNYRASDFEYASELNEAIEELQYLVDGSNDSLYERIIEHVEDREEFDYDAISDEDAVEFDEMVHEIALAQIDYLNEKAEVMDDIHSDEYDEDNDWN